MKLALITFVVSIGLLFNSMIAYAEIAVVTGKNSPINAVTVAEAKDIFLKKKNKLNGNSVLPLDLAKGDATRDAFYESVTNKAPDQVLAYWSKLIFTGKGIPPEVASSPEELVFLFSRNPDLIGYVPSDQVTDDMKILLTVP